MSLRVHVACVVHCPATSLEQEVILATLFILHQKLGGLAIVRNCKRIYQPRERSECSTSQLVEALFKLYGAIMVQSMQKS